MTRFEYYINKLTAFLSEFKFLSWVKVSTNTKLKNVVAIISIIDIDTNEDEPEF